MESLTVLTLLGLYSVGFVAGHLVRSTPNYTETYYAHSDSTFRALAAGGHQQAPPGAVQRPDTTRVDSLIVQGEDSGPGPKKTTAANRSVDVNHATIEELVALPGIGPTIAARIIDYRQRTGPFRTVDQLIDVKGIGPRKLEVIRGLVSVAD